MVRCNTNRIDYKWNKREYGTTYFSFQSSNTYQHMITHRASEFVYCLYIVPLSAVNGLSRLTTTSNGQVWPIPKFSNRPITFESNRNGRFEFESNLKALQVPSQWSPASAICWSWPARRSSSQIIDILRTHILLCQLGMLFLTLKNSTLLLHIFRHQLKHFTSHITSTPSAFEVILQLMHDINYLLTYCTYLLCHRFLYLFLSRHCQLPCSILHTRSSVLYHYRSKVVKWKFIAQLGLSAAACKFRVFLCLFPVGEWETATFTVQPHADAVLPGTAVGSSCCLRHPALWACVCRRWDFWHELERRCTSMYYVKFSVMFAHKTLQMRYTCLLYMHFYFTNRQNEQTSEKNIRFMVLFVSRYFSSCQVFECCTVYRT